MATGHVEPLLGTSNFRVVIGRREFGVAAVTRLSSETRGEEPDQRHTFGTVVLRRALSRATEFHDWRRNIAAGRDDRRDVTIALLDVPGGSPVNSWRLVGAWPVRWSGPSFDALVSEVACEELELAFDDLVWLAAEPQRQPRPSTEGA
jgi:phage tail-like protein